MTEKIAYYSDWLYLPHGVLNGASIKAALSFAVRSRGKVVGAIRAYKEDEDYLYVPREFYTPQQLGQVGIAIERQIPKFEQAQFQDRIVLRDEVQEEAFAKMVKAGGGVLCLLCGGGKTVLALKYAAHLGVPALVVVHTEDLLRQWKGAVTNFLGMEPGTIQGPLEKWTWDRPIVMAMIQTLAERASDIPRAIRRKFGLVIHDECHHVSAPFFSKTAHLFSGTRLGLTATPEREDGLHPLFLAHLGRVFFTYLHQPLTPELFFVDVKTGLSWPKLAYASCDANGDFNFSKMWQVLARDRLFLDRCLALIGRCIREGRKTLILCRTHAALYALAEETEKLAPGQVGIVTGKERGKNREEAITKKNLIFGVAQLAKEGLDRPDLDTLILLEPIKARGVLQQTLGRISRDVPKQAPRVYVMRTPYPPIYAMCNAMRKPLREWGIPFSIVKGE